jgi:hypothetical protein
MNFNKIVQLRLFKDKQKLLKWKDHYKVVYLDKENYTQYEKELKQVIIYIKHQLTDWIDSPTYDVVEKRFDAGCFCFLFYYKDKCIGWNWGHKHVVLDWINVHNELPDDECYLGGCFVTNLVDRPADAGIMDYNMFIKESFNLGYNCVYAYCDDWNRVALRINFSNGGEVYNFIKE